MRLTSPGGSPWMRGITPARLGVVALICIVTHATNETFPVGETWGLRIYRTLHNAAVFFLAALPMCRIAMGEGKPRDSIVAGAMLGLAGACKYVPLLALLPLLLVHARGVRNRWFWAAVAAALIAMFLATPFTFLDWKTTFRDIVVQRKSLFGPRTWRYSRGTVSVLWLKTSGAAAATRSMAAALWTKSGVSTSTVAPVRSRTDSTHR